ncbi:Trihelix transcription factor GT-2 [Platanthera zijinensis]|uniref:Trihelix transcription factor GT-2 n=1 Tax=Platanthera zijinensis TaxID=2320716 RepID=A0AAP0FVI3_9ASPA
MQQGGGSRFPAPLPSPEFRASLHAPAQESVAPITTFNETGLPAVGEEKGMVLSVSPRNRWPRQETSALLTIRSDMDAAFRGANLKSPLWEEVSRRLTEMGYCRSAKKCKEKFENVYKYYNRTKEARAGRQDGKCYRFFSQLEALHCSSSSVSAIPGEIDAPAPVPRAIAPPPSSDAAITAPAATAAAPIEAFGLSSSSNTSSYSGTDSEEDGEESAKRKRNREGADGGEETPKCRQKLMTFFEALMQRVLERQEAMQQRLLDAIERREQRRTIREEAWRRQDVSRIAREQELAAQERAAAACRGDAIVAFLQKLTGRKIPIPPPPHALQTTTHAAAVAPNPEQTPTSPPTQKCTEITAIPTEPPQAAPPPEHRRFDGNMAIVLTETGPSRWPKSEVHALIKLRSGMEGRYQESCPKGPLWEEISAEMRRLGYDRSSKRCKEKWENINKYFKKVKESSKKRAEDDKTCPYFHQLDAFYRRKLLGNAAHTEDTHLCAPDADPKFAALPAAASPQPRRQQVDTRMPGEGVGGDDSGFSLGFLEEGHCPAVAAKHMATGRS